MKKALTLLTVILVTALSLTGCGKATKNSITVISREEGSGTRSAFEELVEIDETTALAEISDSTAVMITTVEGNTSAIGYISLGAMSDAVKALKIDNVEACSENIKNGTYKISRPFNIATRSDISNIAQDFIKFILSEQGQKVIENNKYISSGNTGVYTAKNLSGTIKIAGSSSVTPVMEKLKEAYNSLNPDVIIDLQQSDSTNGITSTIEGICDIGMVSRELKASEISKGLNSTAIALDAIVVIVNQENPLDNISIEQLSGIYTKKINLWSEIK
ncbi:MAG: substrate-binding domain-containing protein [Clostridia bacterium]|nr:substrate-binding domain-containing protein [Clostridia bacterium]